MTTATLERIPGIGKQKAANLLKQFGGLSGVRKATEEELRAVKGISAKDATQILSYFKE